MAVRMEDLPPWAQRQAMQKINIQENSKRTFEERDVSNRKYHNKRVQKLLDNGIAINFDSKKEAQRYDELMLMLKSGAIRDLKLQPQFTIQEAYTTQEGNRVRAIRYQADFSYERETEPDCNGATHWLLVVEDVKSEATKTRVYEIKKKLLREKFGINIVEVMNTAKTSNDTLC